VTHAGNARLIHLLATAPRPRQRWRTPTQVDPRYALEAPAARLPESSLGDGKAPIDLQVRGTTYSDGGIRQYNSGTTLHEEPGEQVPVVLNR